MSFLEINVKPGVIFDYAGEGRNFGDVIKDVLSQYKTGSQVKVVFVGAHPRNNLQLEGSYLTVERLNETTSKWDILATDANWETK